MAVGSVGKAAVAGRRTQVYGCQPKWKKLMKQLAGRRTEEKFDEVVQQLTELTAQVWELQEGGPGGSSARGAPPPNWAGLYIMLHCSYDHETLTRHVGGA